ncbi:MFS general substrate transporter [Teratosphaeria nubilosa]|uniref:MFS general substrate transporter n=1 Tax=Teratosphaeria nubilosa TaxID=161662 RepID=A0A6G1L2K9_9PEZI|nr:MFS general substrate transporter [Teratosphaeria nubilosa]
MSVSARQSFDDKPSGKCDSSRDRSEADGDQSRPGDVGDGPESRPSGPPEGGFKAWLQVLCGFIMFWHAWGLVNSYGVFQKFYSTVLLPTDSESNISWIGSLEGALLAFTTIFAGPLFDAGHGRQLVIGGSFLVVLGLMMTSLCTTYWQLILAQGLCTGIGAGALFLVAVAVLPAYFGSKRALAIGIAASGSPLGGIVYPIIFHYLVPRVGFGWTTRIIGFISLALLVIPCLFLRPIMSSRTTVRKIIDFSGFRELRFNLLCIAIFCGNCGLYIPFFYISQYAHKEGFSPELAFYMLPLLSAGSIPGRIIPGFLADLVGPLNVLTICTALAGVLGFCWVAIGDSIPGLIIWALSYGCFSGAFLSLQPTTIVSITSDLGIVGGRLGTSTFFCALGVLVGSPVGGAILSQASSWVGIQVFCGAILLLASLFAFLTRSVGRRIQAKS